MLEECLELHGGVDIRESVEKRVRNVGARGLDVKKAMELGLFDRISHLLCGMQTLFNTAYRLYGEVDMWLSTAGAKRHQIKRACNDFERAYDAWFNFWNEYNTKEGNGEISNDAEILERHFMRWAKLPEYWHLGEAQHTEDGREVAIRIEEEDNIYTFHTSIAEREDISEPQESWCVTKYDLKSKMQETVNTDMDKASAYMVAKRLSFNDKENIYTASRVMEIQEKRTEVIPCAAFKANEEVGDKKDILKEER